MFRLSTDDAQWAVANHIVCSQLVHIIHPKVVARLRTSLKIFIECKATVLGACR